MSTPAARLHQDLRATAQADTHTTAPDVWASAAHARVPDDAWEYQVRKSLNDAAYTGLDYMPYCSTMPVPPRCEAPKFAWKKKTAPH